MKYHKLFNNHTEYESYLKSSEYKKPCLAYCRRLKEVHYYKKKINYKNSYFTIEALEDGNVYFKYLSFATTTDQRYMEYSKDGGETWNRTTNVDNEEVIMTIPMLTGETAFVRGDNDTLCAYNENWEGYYGSNFYSDINFNASGNIMSLIYGDTFVGEAQTVDYMFSNLFFDMYGDETETAKECLLTNACNLILPATTLANYCYTHMFSGCTSLTATPELPATTLAKNCYHSMFLGCSSLTTAPALPATTLANNCYESMFSGCASLTTAPELPATTLANDCYDYMFSWCTSLTRAPELPATTLASSCYDSMFYGCTSLTAAPELPATTLVNYCYHNMFSGCTRLNYIKAMFTTKPTTSYTFNWVRGVSSTGTFVKNIAATWNVTGYNGVPSGWTVQTVSA